VAVEDGEGVGSADGRVVADVTAGVVVSDEDGPDGGSAAHPATDNSIRNASRRGRVFFMGPLLRTLQRREYPKRSLKSV